MEKMFIAYFQEAKDLSQIEEIVACVSQVEGLSASEARTVLESNEFKDEVMHKYKTVRGVVNGVPYFIVKNQRGGRPTAFSGAQVTN